MTANYWHGKNVRLRGIEPADAELFYRWNLDSERARRLDFVWPPISQAAVREWVEQQARQRLDQDAFHWIIENRDGEPVGAIRTSDCRPHDGTFSYSVDVAAEYRRQGYASEAIAIVLGYYFEELRYQKVTVAVHADNEGSVRLHEKLGFRREGTHRRMFFTGGRYVDVLWYGLTVEEFHDLIAGWQALP